MHPVLNTTVHSIDNQDNKILSLDVFDCIHIYVYFYSYYNLISKKDYMLSYENFDIV